MADSDADLVNPKYIHPLLTFPLPPMVMREWGEEVTHSDLPLPKPEDLMGVNPLEADPNAKPPATEEDADDFASAAKRPENAGMRVAMAAAAKEWAWPAG